MLLIFRLGRPDVLPVDDYGVRKGFAKMHKLAELPKPKELLAYGERWRPYRSVASWYLWRAAEMKDLPMAGDRRRRKQYQARRKLRSEENYSEAARKAARGGRNRPAQNECWPIPRARGRCSAHLWNCHYERSEESAFVNAGMTAEETAVPAFQPLCPIPDRQN